MIRPLRYLAWLKLVLWLASAVRAEHVEIVCETAGNCTPFSCSVVSSYGSGVTIGKLKDGRDAVLTCAHVVRGARKATISWYNQAVIPATVVASGDADGLDVALLAAKLEPPPTERLCLLESPLAHDSAVRVYGFPGGYNSMVVLDAKLFGTTLSASQSIRQGMSGGAVVYKKQVAGIVWGCEVGRPCRGEFTPSWRIRPWLDKRLGYVPDCAGPKSQAAPVLAPPAPPSSQSSAESRTAGAEPHLAAALDRISALERAIADLQSRPVQAGPPGPPGPRGAQGPPGKDCECAGGADVASVEASLAQIRAELQELKRIKFPVRTLKPDGSVFSEGIVTLGEPIELRLVPRQK